MFILDEVNIRLNVKSSTADQRFLKPLETWLCIFSMSCLGETDGKNKARYMSSPLFSLVILTVWLSSLLTLILTLHSALYIIFTGRDSAIYKCWLMSPCGNISSSLLLTTAALSVSKWGKEEQRKRLSMLQPRFFHWRETVFLGWTTEAIFSICLLQQGCATALTWKTAFWETLTAKVLIAMTLLMKKCIW